jgi:hypothetical protein
VINGNSHINAVTYRRGSHFAGLCFLDQPD